MDLVKPLLRVVRMIDGYAAHRRDLFNEKKSSKGEMGL